MRKAEKKEISAFVDSFYQVHEEIKEALNQRNMTLAQNMLSECQEFAIQMGNIIEELEGEGHVTVSHVQEYCETLFHVFEASGGDDVNANKFYKLLNKQLIKIENSVRNDIIVRKEIVFFPYKASMWDSLESVYLAAKEDPDCDVYCVPIPYFDLRSDHTLGQMHYEGHEYPENIEIIDWQFYSFEERKPDVIYIHNPYDEANLVTSIHPRFYSSNLKKYTDTLVYIPYYVTSGGMSDGQSICPAYIYADYIVIQAPGLRAYFDERIPDEKFLAFGSPKFDKVIKKCQNPPEPPAEWQTKMEGKKVYFYNTSIHGMLQDTGNFLKKMKYVFSCFEGREDACLLWRPHPLMESTFDSMRPWQKQEYLSLKSDFIRHDLGIYDTTPDMEDTIALCDAYIGDAGSSVTSLFGIAGKPLFILNNRLHSEPEADSWRGEISTGFNYWHQNRFLITQGNKLYVSDPFMHDYKYFCDVSEYANGGCYSAVWEIGKKLYVCPQNEQNILMIDGEGNRRKIELKQIGGKLCSFGAAVHDGRAIYLLPIKYPAIVKYDTVTEELKYFTEYMDIFLDNDEVIRMAGGCWVEEKLCILSAVNRQMYMLNVETGKAFVTELPFESGCQYRDFVKYGEEYILLPYKGEHLCIGRWDPDTNEVQEYDRFPQGLQCSDPVTGKKCMERPFNSGVLWGDDLYLTPDYANMYVKLNLVTGEMIEWKPPFNDGEGKEYFYTTAKSSFFYSIADEEGWVRIFSYPRRKMYEVNLINNDCKELEIRFDVEELKAHEPGFCFYSEQLRYCCQENSFNSIRNFLDGTILGNSFDRSRQIEVYREIARNNDGTCGTKIHEFMCKL